MRPILHPALTTTWRDDSTLQIGVTADSAVLLGGLGAVEKAVLKAMDNEHDLWALREVAIEYGGEKFTADRFVDTLVSYGAAIDAAETSSVTPRLQPDLSSIGLQNPARDGGAAALHARGRRRVDVHGAGRIGASIARLLSAAGVGDVVVRDPAPARDEDVTPGGSGPKTVGRSRESAIEASVRSDTVAPPERLADSPDLTVLAHTTQNGRAEAAELVRHGTPHLLVQLIELTGIVGPLVIPGQSSCLRCHDLHRTDLDPHWPLTLDQITRRPPAHPACDTGLAATVAGITVVQALAHLDGFHAAAVDGTIEVTVPSGMPRRRSWEPHRACGCGWS